MSNSEKLLKTLSRKLSAGTEQISTESIKSNNVLAIWLIEYFT